MDRQVSVRQVLGAVALVVVVLVCVVAANRLQQPEGGDGGTTYVSPQDLDKAGGYGNLNGKQKKFCHDLVLAQLAALHAECDYRLAFAERHGQRQVADDLKLCLSQLEEASARVEAGGDPTQESSLVATIRRALARR